MKVFVGVLGAMLGLMLGVLGDASPAHAEDCTDPWVVVVRKDNTTVEGRLIKDGDTGVLLESGGKSVFVPEADITEVVEDCSRRAPAPKAGGIIPAPAAPRGKLATTESRFRNNMIDGGQKMLRWVGSGCMGLGCSLFGSGVVVGVLTLAGAIAQQQSVINAVAAAGVIVVIATGVAAVIGGSGAAMLLGAQLADGLRFTPEGPAPAADDPLPDTLGSAAPPSSSSSSTAAPRVTQVAGAPSAPVPAAF